MLCTESITRPIFLSAASRHLRIPEIPDTYSSIDATFMPLSNAIIDTCTTEVTHGHFAKRTGIMKNKLQIIWGYSWGNFRESDLVPWTVLVDGSVPPQLLRFSHLIYHRLRGSASPVVKVTSHFNGKLQNLTPRISQTP